jgi:hypothetical protein
VTDDRHLWAGHLRFPPLQLVLMDDQRFSTVSLTFTPKQVFGIARMQTIPRQQTVVF